MVEVPVVDLSSAFWLLIGALISVVATILIMMVAHWLTRPRFFWIATGWTSAIGLLLQGLGVFYEITVQRGDGLLMLISGAALIALAGIFATIAAKYELEERSEASPKEPSPERGATK